jgi:DNA mismatch repair protein MutS
MQYPLLSCSAIEERQKGIASFISRAIESKKARELLSQIRDLERLMMRVNTRCATPRDLFALGTSLSHVPAIKELLPEQNLPDVGELSQRILKALSDTPPLRMGEGDIFRDGYHPELDRLRQLSKDSMSWMARYQVTLREETGIKTLKVGYTKAFGYYIEVSRAQSEKIPSTFQRRQTLINAERFITEELKQFEHQVLTAEERAKALEAELYEQLRLQVASSSATVHAAAKILARVDTLLSLAKTAEQYRWTCPLVDTSDVLEIVEGRHPVVEKAIGKAAFIPNDTKLDPTQQLMLITGPNMAGKSTYIRQVALVAILAQIGSYVPAKTARIGLIDKVFSRIGASDDLARGQSTFMVEMSETANILNNATSRSLVLLDEIGRGTSTFDGISIAWAVSEYLLTTTKKQAKTLFATHYWELTKLETKYPHAANFQIAVQEISSGIVFLRKIVKGGTDKSYGIHVAKLAGLPTKVIKRAEEMLKELENDQLPLFVSAPEEHPVLAALKKIDLLNLTPIQAHHKLCELKQHAL